MRVEMRQINNKRIDTVFNTITQHRFQLVCFFKQRSLLFLDYLDNILGWKESKHRQTLRNKQHKELTLFISIRTMELAFV